MKSWLIDLRTWAQSEWQDNRSDDEERAIYCSGVTNACLEVFGKLDQGAATAMQTSIHQGAAAIAGYVGAATLIFKVRQLGDAPDSRDFDRLLLEPADAPLQPYSRHPVN